MRYGSRFPYGHIRDHIYENQRGRRVPDCSGHAARSELIVCLSCLMAAVSGWLDGWHGTDSVEGVPGNARKEN